MRILLENENTVLKEYFEKEMKELIDTLEFARNVFEDDGMRCIYLLKAEKILQKILINIADSHL